MSQKNMDTYFIMYRWSTTFIYNNNRYTLRTSTFAFHKVVWWHYSGEVGKFIIFLCDISSGYCTPKITEIDSVFTEIFKN